jgi:site-specific DNA recombinase
MRAMSRATHLSPVGSITQPRAVLYLRQSISKEESISLELQEEAGRAYAERRGYDVVAVEQDPGISGRTWVKRPAVQRVVAMIERGEADVIVLWKWSRLSRSRRDWAVAVDLIETKGGRIESATEPVDTTTSAGRFARGMLAELAAFESERIGETWKEAQARRVRMGMPANGRPRFGFTYSKESGYQPDPISAPALAEAFRRYTRGDSVHSVVAWLNAGPTRPVRGYGVTSDGLWSANTLRRVLDSGFGAGFISHGGELLPGAHAALISPDEWEAYLEARGRRRVYGRAERSEYLLSGLLRCGECGASMTAGYFGAAKMPKYRCNASNAKQNHRGGHVTGAVVERFVFDWVLERQTRLEAEAEAAPPARPVPAVENAALVIERRLAQARSKLDTATESYLDGTIPKAAYERARDRLSDEIAALESQRRTDVVAERKAPLVVIRGVLDRWGDVPIPYRRELLRALIDHVEVRAGRPVATFAVHPR